MESLAFVSLTPLAVTLMLAVSVVAWRRRDAPGGWGLVAFSATSAGWLICDALSVVAPTPETTLRLAQAAILWCPLPGVAWLAFLLGYTERFTRPAQIGIAALTVWSLAFGGMALTNELHRLVWSSWRMVPDGPFLGVAYTLGPLGWAQTMFAWTTVVCSLGVVLWAYAGARARERSLSRWIVVGALIPLAVSVVHLLGFGPIEKDFTPLAMAASSGAFALGIARYHLLDLRPMAREALVDNLREGMLVLDARGQVADANPALRETLGIRIGQTLHRIAPELARAIDETPDETLRLGDGDAARYVDLRISPLADRTGVATGRLVLLHDVTSRREERAALHRANADLYDANAELQARNDELDAFAHTVAHDLKNSIQGVTGWAEVLRDDGHALSPEEHRDIADSVVTMSLKMGTVVHELLMLAGVRQSAIEVQPVAMDAVVAEALGRLRCAQIDMDVATLPSDWPTALGHAPWVEEIWVNYLSNAVKYGGSTVTLGAETTASGSARFWVHDDGPGLTPDEQRCLFVPFSRVGTQSVEGHGLGLSIVRRVTERLGGTCGVESSPEAGTRFWFALPLASAVPDPRQLTEA